MSPSGTLVTPNFSKSRAVFFMMTVLTPLLVFVSPENVRSGASVLTSSSNRSVSCCCFCCCGCCCCCFGLKGLMTGLAERGLAPLSMTFFMSSKNPAGMFFIPKAW